MRDQKSRCKMKISVAKNHVFACCNFNGNIKHHAANETKVSLS